MSEKSMETSCDFALKTIEVLGDEKLGPGRRARLRHHIETCPECKAYFDRMTAVIDILENMPRISAPEGFADKVLEVVMAYIPVGELGLDEEHGHKKVWIAGAVFGVSLALGLAIVRHFVEHEDGQAGEKDEDLVSGDSAVAAAS